MTIEAPLSPMMTSLSDPSMAEVLSDLNLFYIRQIGASLKKHVGLQDRLEREMKIRDGATRLMAACTHETQLLEAAKTLHTSNARTFSYMAELQKMKAAEVMEAIMDEPGFSENTKTCKGRIAISDIRVPLVWKEIHASGKPKTDHGRHAVFCLLSMGSEVQDTELVCIDKTTTDISFSDAIVFENATYDFKLTIEIFAYPMTSSSVSAATPRKLMSRLNRSIGKSEGKRLREHLKEKTTNGIKLGPQYEKIGCLTLTLGEVSDSVRSHDLDIGIQHHLTLPLYESITCRLVAQPKCITDISMSGFLHTMQMVGAVPNWSYMWCEVKAGVVRGWNNPEDSNKMSQFTIDLIPKDVKINEIEKIRQKRPNSFQVRDMVDRHIFAADGKDEMVKWIRGLRQHKNDHGAWGIACISDSANRMPMYIASPSPRKLPSELIFDRGIRKTLVYDQLSMDSPMKAMTEAIKCADLLNDRNTDPDNVAASVQSVLLENQTTAPWAGFFTGLNTKAAKVTRMTDIHDSQSPDAEDNRHGHSLRPSTSHQKDAKFQKFRFKHQGALPSCSEASGSDDAFLSDSDDNTASYHLRSGKILVTGGSKKKRRAPMPPYDHQLRSESSNTPPQKPPLPKLPPKQRLRSKSRASMSSGSSLDGILEERHRRGDSPVPRPRIHQSNENLCCEKSLKRGIADGHEVVSMESVRTCLSSQSSGYKSETDSNGSKMSERSWVKEKNCVMPTAVIPLSGGDYSSKLHSFERSHSLDTEGFHRITSIKPGVSGSTLAPPGGEAIYAEPDECRPRTNTMPQTSPSRLRSRMTSHSSKFSPDNFPKPTPTPRRSYLTAVEASKSNKPQKHIYEKPFCVPQNNKKEDKPAVQYRQLPFDSNANVYRQAKPPVLPPKLSKKVKKREPDQNVEPIYAKVDKQKKLSDRASRCNKGVDAYTKAHHAIITVCKQRMEEEQEKESKNEEDSYMRREVVSRV